MTQLRLGSSLVWRAGCIAAIPFMIAAASQAGVVGWWKMDDPNYPAGYFEVPTPTTADSSGHGNDAELVGNVTVGSTPGQVGNSAVIGTGGGAINAGTDASIKPSGLQYSFATWVKFTDLTPYWQMIGSEWNDGGTPGSKYGYHFGLQDDYLTLYMGVPGADDIVFIASDIAPVALDTWTHVAFTISSNDFQGVTDTITMYRDGTAVASYSTYNYASLPLTSEPIIFGAKTVDKIFPMRGQLDETAIWTSTIAGGDVSALYNKTATPAGISPSTLGGYWTYDNPVPPPATATVTDSSGNAHHGITTPDKVDPFQPAGGRFGGAIDVGVCVEGVNCGAIDKGDEAMTFAAWIKPTDLSGLQIVASQSDDFVVEDWGWQVFLLDSTAYFYLGTGDPNNAFEYVGEITGLAAGAWTHLAMTVTTADELGLTPGEVKLYRDGAQVGDTLAYGRATLIDTDVDMIIGNKVNGAADGRFRGLMDDVLLLDEAISASDIALICSQGVDEWLNPGPDVPGDATKDGKVDELDAQALAAHWGTQSGASWEMGDFNGDHAVNAADASILAANWRYGYQEGSQVPEPSAIALVAGAIVLWSGRRRR